MSNEDSQVGNASTMLLERSWPHMINDNHDGGWQRWSLPRMTWLRSVLLSTTKERTVGSGTDLLHIQPQAHWCTSHSILPSAHYGLACDALETCQVEHTSSTLLAHVRVTYTRYRHPLAIGDDGTHIGERGRRDRFSTIEKLYRHCVAVPARSVQPA